MDAGRDRATAGGGGGGRGELVAEEDAGGKRDKGEQNKWREQRREQKGRETKRERAEFIDNEQVTVGKLNALSRNTASMGE